MRSTRTVGRIFLGGVVAMIGGSLLPLALARPDPDTIPSIELERSKRPKRPVVRAPQRQLPDVIFVPTPQPVVDKMLELARVKKGDVVYDLGCGDGRIVVTAAKKHGAYGFGFEIDAKLVEMSKENARKQKVQDAVDFLHADIFDLDLSEADVVTLYLLPRLNVKLIPQLSKMKAGSRVVSHDFDMEGVKPDKVVRINAADDRGNAREHTLYLWTLPLKKQL
jgi:SAM-dependent methyltransferase